MQSKKEIEQTISPNEIKAAIEALHNLPNCKHCGKNEKAEKPFSKMKKIHLTSLSEKVLEETAKKYSIKETSCLICLTIDNFSKLPCNQQLNWLKGESNKDQKMN